ncbi:MAG: helix-turn-helix domain-containing protein [Bifidobacteriaceae bacterium]|nr:helix-turn-helix domain-containing protein [Bifidobacteriaceae bacterium]
MALPVVPEHTDGLADVADALDNQADVSLVTGDGKAVELPAELREVLSTAAQALVGGQEVLVVTKDSYLTAQEAAEFLGVSRPTLIRILDLGEVPFERPNSHRRIRLADLARYKRERVHRRRILDRNLADADEFDAYDTDSFVSTR